MSEVVRTRFAPSPTGYMHVGGLRTALFAWLVARQAKGQFILRIEDTDRTRHVEESERHIMESLAWLGLEWDEGPDKGRSHGPYRQSQRLKIYKEWAQKLISSGRAYTDPYSPEELAKLRVQAKAQKQPFLFREHRPDNPPPWQAGRPLRFKSEPKKYSWDDLVLGNLSTGPEAVDDFIIIKSDGFPTYNFAHIVDDKLMQISHVIRSQEFLPSVPRFLNLYEALEIERPLLATLPYVMAPDGSQKLSKRHGAKDILEYRDDGYLPEALINFLASLGWNDGSEQEIFSKSELIEKFKLERVQRSGARFDEERLSWMNGHYIRAMSLEALAKSAEDFWPTEAKTTDSNYKKAVLDLLQERLRHLAEIPALSHFFFAEPDDNHIRNLYQKPPDKLLQKTPPKQFVAPLETAQKELSQSDFSHDDIAKRLNDLLAKLKTKPGELFPLLRIAVSGQPATPELFATLNVLGKDRTMQRIDKALSILREV